MKSHRLWVCACAMIATMAAVNAPGAFAQEVDPQVIADRCEQHVTAIAERSANRNARTAEYCVNVISDLLAEGNEDRANRVAQFCERIITASSNWRVRLIENICRWCIRSLEQLGAPELVAGVDGACSDAVAAVRDSQESAIAAIQDALNDDG